MIWKSSLTLRQFLNYLHEIIGKKLVDKILSFFQKIRFYLRLWLKKRTMENIPQRWPQKCFFSPFLQPENIQCLSFFFWKDLLHEALWVLRGSISFLYSRGWVRIIRTSILLHSSQKVALRVTSQAIGQNYWSRSFKWGIVHLCNSNSIEDMTKNRKYDFLKFLRF